MNSYTPLDIDKFRAEHQFQSDGTTPEVNFVPPPSPPKSSRFPLFAMLALTAVFFTTLVYMNQISQQTKIQQTDAYQPQPVKKIITLSVGTDGTFPPMEFENENKELIGYDIELGKELANEMGVNIQFTNISWDEIFNSLEDRKIDLIISSVTITDERKMKFDFSDPYLNAGQVIITKKTNEDIKSPLDLKDKKVGVQKGTTNELEAAKYTADTNVIRYDDFLVATKDLIEGKVDAILSDLPGAKGIVTSSPELKISSDPFTEEYYGILFRKDQTELRAKVNQALTSLRQKGILNNLKEKYLD